MGKIEDNKQQKKERLLETAFSLFTSKGMAKTSVSDITASAGVAKGTFYLYFRDKYDLGDKLIAHKSASLFRHAIEQVKQSDAATAEDKLIVLVDDILNQLQKNPLALRFINKNLSWGTLKKALSRPDAVEEMDYLGYIQSILYES
ncbi:MAG: TetR/AcrR family transcriptional regulator, partial [Butyricicoccaceae bacterium]